MRVIQLLPTIAYGDAVSNDTLVIQGLLAQMGYETAIYAENIDERLPRGAVCPLSELPVLSKEDVIIYHGSTGTDLNDRLPEMAGRKVMIYHNITPPDFFRPYASIAADAAASGIRGMEHLADQLEYCIADSEYNKKDLLRMGFNCPIDVCPVLIPFGDYETPPSQKIVRTYGTDGYTNILFVGRIVPNKKVENVIRAFYFYHKYYHEKSRLFLVGSCTVMGRYYQRLVDYTQRLGLTDSVVFTGHIKFNEILAYYKIADVFLCMSEHEGFCVPLLEAMYFDVPVVAYRCAAVPDTLGGSGVLLETTDPREAAERIDEIVRDETLRRSLIDGQRTRLAEFQYGPVSERLRNLLSDFMIHPKGRRPRLVQAVTSIHRGDAIGNDMRALQSVFVDIGLPAPICAENIFCQGNDFPQDTSLLQSLNEKDTVLYHHGVGTNLAKQFADLSCKKILVYHNVTPSEFFAPFQKDVARGCRWGLENVRYMSGRVDACIADSEFNKQDLQRLGYRGPIGVCPILIPFDDYAREPDRATVERYSDGRTNVIFVGRIAPNKKFEDIISAFAAYKRDDAAARLILVGSYGQQDAYYEYLRRHVENLGVEDVIFTGHISFPEILAYYRTADIFLCMSEHEGFCVPLVEAMYFDIPIVAYPSTAIPETLGGSGVLLDTKAPQAAAEEMLKLVRDGEYREKIIRGQRERLKDFSHEKVEATFLGLVKDMLGGQWE